MCTNQDTLIMNQWVVPGCPSVPAIGPETGVSRRALGACRGAELAPRESWSLVCNCSDINGGAPLVAIEEDCCSSLSNGLNLARS